MRPAPALLATIALAALMAQFKPVTTPVAGLVAGMSCLALSVYLTAGRLPARFGALAFAAAAVVALLGHDPRVALMFGVVAMAWTAARARPRRLVRILVQLTTVLAGAWCLGVLSPDADARLTAWLAWATHATALLTMGLGAQDRSG